MRAIVSLILCRDYDLVKLRSAIAQAVYLQGGWPEKIKSAKRLLINPNLLSSREPEHAVTTHPLFVRAVIQEIHAFDPNKEIVIGDAPANLRSWEHLWNRTEMITLLDEPHTLLVPFDVTKRLELSNGIVLPVVDHFFNCDALLTLPKLKTHVLTKVTCAVKNGYGLIVGEAKSNFHSEHPSPKEMSLFLAQCYGALKPDFAICDAIIGMEGDGPAGGTPVEIGLIFASTDAVALDAVACKVYGYAPEDIVLLKKCADLGFGIIKKDEIERVGNGVEHLDTMRHLKRSKADWLYKIPNCVFNLFSRFLKCTPFILQNKCVQCGLCAQVCSQKAIQRNRKNAFEVKVNKCIVCVCCMEVCPHKAMEIRAVYHRLLNLFRSKR